VFYFLTLNIAGNVWVMLAVIFIKIGLYDFDKKGVLVNPQALLGLREGEERSDRLNAVHLHSGYCPLTLL